MVPDDSLTIRQKCIAAWPPAWHGQNLKDMLVTLGYDIDKPWREMSKTDRDWILFTDEQPVVPVYANFEAHEVKAAMKRKEPPSYNGNFSSAKRHVLYNFANTQSAAMKKRVSKYMVSAECRLCKGKRLRLESLSVKFAGLDIADITSYPIIKLSEILRPYADGSAPALVKLEKEHPEKAIVAQRIAFDLNARISVLLDLGLGYLALDRGTPTLSPGELQRLRLATQVRSNLFGVVYVLDEPSAGLHPADTEALLSALEQLKSSGNSLFVVEHDLDVIKHADWIVDVGPAAGEQGGYVLYSGPASGLAQVEESQTRRYLFAEERPPQRKLRKPSGWLKLSGVTRNNLNKLDVAFPLGAFTTITGVSGSGKSSLVSKLGRLVASSQATSSIEEVKNSKRQRSKTG
jgi:excinuclease ABC subunit A